MALVAVAGCGSPTCPVDTMMTADGRCVPVADTGVVDDASVDGGVANDAFVSGDACALTTYYRDVDGDMFGDASDTMSACRPPSGYVSTSTDCDDMDDAVYPGATEVCNGVDDNCAAGIDEGVGTTFYVDGDGDGIGGSTPVVACELAAGRSVRSDDCDDTNAAVNPTATEVCNGIDDNCVGGIDEGVQMSFFEDLDNDTYGSAVVRMACAPAMGLATRSGDCNDGNAAIFPTALERCDGIDNDCDTVSDGPSATLWCGQPAQLASLSAVSAVCGGGTCQATSCAAMRGNCDSMGACETDTSSSAANCGTCGTVCAWNRCSASVCNDAIQISAGVGHTCALRRDGTVVCWGWNQFGQLGNGTIVNSATPVVVSGLSGIQSISAGGGHTCALAISGVVSCWGQGSYGQLGRGTTADQTTPQAIASLPASVRQISSGEAHTCAVLATGATYCWGENTYGQLGDGTSTNRLTPTLIAGSNSALVVAGSAHTCALAAGSSLLFCWGSNPRGQLGDGTTINRLAPAYSSAFGAVQSVAVGEEHTCVITTTGGVQCVGLNSTGQLGNGTTTNATSPTTVSGLSMAAELRTGSATTYVRLADGTMRAWGSNSSGRLGDGTTVNRLTPTIVSGSVIEVTAGRGHACSRSSTGVVRCWGSNTYGQLGNGTTVNSSTPVIVTAP